MMRPVRPPMEKRKMNEKRKKQRRVDWMEPLYRVATQLKILTPVGTATRKVMKEK